MSALQDYEYEIKDKNFIFRLFEKFKTKKNQLLLGPSKEEELRRNSSDLMWRVTGFKANIFDKIGEEKRRNKIIDEKDRILIEVIGKPSIQNEFAIANNKIEKLIIPKGVNLGKKDN